MKAWLPWLRLAPVFALFIALVVGGVKLHFKDQRDRCWSQLHIYNGAIASCGMSNECTEAWKSPEATEKLVLKIFEKQLPACPSGGKLTWVYGSKFQHHPCLPALVCSKHSP